MLTGLIREFTVQAWAHIGSTSEGTGGKFIAYGFHITLSHKESVEDYELNIELL